MKTDDPIILRRLEEIEQACAGLRMACGFPELHAVTSRREGQRHPAPLEALAALVHREWDDYPDRAILQDELTDRGATREQAAALIDNEHWTRREAEADQETS